MNSKRVKFLKQEPITLDDMTINHWEEYDVTQMQIMRFIYRSDIVDGAQFNIGNPLNVYEVISQIILVIS